MARAQRRDTTFTPMTWTEAPPSTTSPNTAVTVPNRLFWVKGAWQGGRGVPWGQTMENEFEYLVDRGGHGGH